MAFPNYDYGAYIDFVAKTHRWLSSRNMVLIGLYDEKRRDWLQCHCVSSKDVSRPYQIIGFEQICSSPAAMKELFSHGFTDALEEYRDDATR